LTHNNLIKLKTVLNQPLGYALIHTKTTNYQNEFSFFMF